MRKMIRMRHVAICRLLPLLVATAVAAFLAAAPAQARLLAQSAEPGIELHGGTGRAVLSLRGAVLGSLDRGNITVTVRRGQPLVLVQGYEWHRPATNGGITYGGRDLRFRVFRGAWRVVLNGSGIDVSAVGRGIVGLRGTGRFSLGGAAYQFWPVQYETIRLGPPNANARAR